ncbi:MAG: ferrous iron transport protein B [Clostridium sp.]|nr:ferrous iron transport protein B [Clostridium sp.]
MKTAALIGNPNVGKTSLFNVLTGSNQYVGNWAGVTVEKKEGFLDKSFKIVDLPGIYAMDTYSNEEKVSKNFLLNEKVDVIINIVDASNLNRNLYLTTQLLEFKIPIILVVNMVDVAKDKGIEIDYEKLGSELNVTVIPIIASKNKNIEKVIDMLLKSNFLCTATDNDYHFQDEKETYAFIENILKKCTTFNNNSMEEKSFSEKLDKIILNRFLAYPIFAIILLITFLFTFNFVGGPLQNLLDIGINNYLIPELHVLLSGQSAWFSSLLIDGVIGGVGSIIVFFPLILSLFFCISILEDSGYMARAALLMDKFMTKIGLSGKAFIPMIMGLGCSVPAIMSTKTLESEKDRKLTALLVPLMSCNARLPIYVLLASAFFPRHEGLVICSLYLLGMLIAFIIGLLFKNTLFKKGDEPLIIELPDYKIPNLKNLLMHTWDKGKGFLKKAGTIIFSISVLLWVLSNFNFTGKTDIQNSFLAFIGHIIAPLFKPLGFSNWQNSVALLSGLAAKEVVVSTMGVLYGAHITAIIPTIFTPLTAYVFLVFVLLYPACISAIGTMKKEYGTKMALFSFGYQIALAWCVSFIVYHIGLLIV